MCRVRIASISRCWNGKTCWRTLDLERPERRTSPASPAAADRGTSPAADAGAVRVARAQREGQARASQLLDLVGLFVPAELRADRARVPEIQGRPGRREDLRQRHHRQGLSRAGRGAALGKAARSRRRLALSARQDPGRRAADLPRHRLPGRPRRMAAGRVRPQLPPLRHRLRRDPGPHQREGLPRKARRAAASRPGSTMSAARSGRHGRDRRQRLDRGRLDVCKEVSALEADHGARLEPRRGAAVHRVRARSTRKPASCCAMPRGSTTSTPRS
jgi:hypothetical protein